MISEICIIHIGYAPQKIVCAYSGRPGKVIENAGPCLLEGPPSFRSAVNHAQRLRVEARARDFPAEDFLAEVLRAVLLRAVVFLEALLLRPLACFVSPKRERCLLTM